MASAKLPRGTVTLLFTDIEGSTRLLQELGEATYVRALEDHRRLVRQAFVEHGGVEVEMQGDSFHFAFDDPREAVLAAAQAQAALAAHAWQQAPIRVRIGIHTGEPLVSGQLYAGLDVHRAARVMSAGHGGQVLVSETTRSLVEAGLPRALSLRDLGEHRLKDLSAPQRLFQLGEEEFPPLKSLYQTNLPVPATPFLGREREVQEVTALLADASTRVLTLTGAGGSGKTRLAAQAAADVAELYPDGVFWVGLASLREPTLVTAAIARVVGATDGLAEHIGSKRLLLLLDNLEHLLAAGGELAALVTACPNLTLLVTSREPLHLTGEREYAVLPLREADAVSLFHERVRALGIELTTDGRVPEICRRLDRLPLAIELAAARTKVLSPTALLDRLEQRLPLLTGGARDLPERQRTLRSTIAWSYELLGAEERSVFARLAVFAGGCTLEAAEGVCRAELDTLQSLVEKSLLRHSDGRFSMLETIREFAGERLQESGEADAMHELHAGFFVELADRRYADLRGGDAAVWLARFEHEHANFRSVLAHLLETGDSARALQLAGALSRFWMSRGHLSEGRRWLERTLGSSDVVPGRPRALRGLALIEMEQGDLDRAAAAATEALELDRERGDEEGAALAMGYLADIGAHRGEVDQAARLWEECIQLWRRLGRRLELAIDLYSLAWIARLRGEPAQAEAYLEESHTIFRELGDVRGQAGTLTGLVQIALDRGDLGRSRSMLATATVLYQSIRFVAGLLDLLEVYATVFEREGASEATARLWGARHTLGGEVGREADHPLELAAHDEAVARVRSALGDEAFEREWRRGSAMTLDEAVAFALEQGEPVPAPTIDVTS
ncbi:MAG TPA: adenylate/guanylate cyclase domain-containing protein [Gaiellaceae bacterium]|nr:adenylate/guanylate cyclase domain-containing protein [Gaiellaceae bacterium]